MFKPRSLLSFLRDRRANVGITFALTATPLLILSGMSLDYARASLVRSKVQQVSDMAILSVCKAARAGTLSEAALKTLGTDLFLQTIDESHARVTRIEPSLVPGEWEMKGEVDVQPTFTSLIPVDKITVGASAACQVENIGLEVALVLDNTGSMASNNRIGALRTAATNLVTMLEQAHTPERPVRVALVPFVTSVNVRGPEFKWSWIDQNADNSQHGINFDSGTPGTRVNHLTLYNQLGINWKGCVEARPSPYALTDAPPTTAIGDTLFVPYFAPDEPGGRAAAGNSASAYNNSYLDDLVTGSDEVRQRSILKYASTTPRTLTETPPLTNGPNRACPTPIQPLTSDFNSLRTQIAGMWQWNGSGTNVAEGLSWGWRVLSPEEPYTTGRPFTDEETRKIVLLLTDGENVVYGASGTRNRSDYGSYNLMVNGRFGTQDQTIGARRVDEWVLQVCNELKNRNVAIYTITLEADTTANRTLYSACATRPDMYYPTNDVSALNGTFKAIGAQITAMRLVR
jgi:Flp pilus assembly protein TadG